jgi:hypothetical protein
MTILSSIEQIIKSEPVKVLVIVGGSLAALTVLAIVIAVIVKRRRVAQS